MNLPLEERVSTLEAQMEATQAILNQTVILQQQNVEAIKQITIKQDRNSEAIAQGNERLDQMDRLQKQNIEAIAELTAKQKHNDNLFAEVLRVMGNLGSRSNRNEAGVEALHDAVGRLTRAADADRQEMRNATNELRSMTSRLDALVNYLMKRS